MGKAKQKCTGGIVVTVHAVNKFRARCRSHPNARKGTATQIERAVREMVRKGESVAHPGLKEGELLVRIRYSLSDRTTEVAYAIIAPSLRDHNQLSVKTIFTPGMNVNGVVLP